MKRNEFFSVIGVSAATVFFVPFLVGCSKSSAGLGSGNPIDFTLDLTATANVVLTSDGGSVVKNGVIVVRTSANTYVALSDTCTHQGGTLHYDSVVGRFLCPVHGANFSTSGSVLVGPATVALQKYNTTLTGTSLRVYS
jgi:cytochrome b6-f complex iron-sulfur subunit